MKTHVLARSFFIVAHKYTHITFIMWNDENAQCRTTSAKLSYNRKRHFDIIIRIDGKFHTQGSCIVIEY
jgi:hypothetical protein